MDNLISLILTQTEVKGFFFFLRLSLKLHTEALYKI